VECQHLIFWPESQRRVQYHTAKVILCGVMARLVGSIPAEGDGFSRAIKIRSTPSFRGEVKLSAPCHKVLWYVKNPFEVWTKKLCKAKFIISFGQFPYTMITASLTSYLYRQLEWELKTVCTFYVFNLVLIL
jgi:hypothetical protein